MSHPVRGKVFTMCSQWGGADDIKVTPLLYKLLLLMAAKAGYSEQFLNEWFLTRSPYGLANVSALNELYDVPKLDWSASQEHISHLLSLQTDESSPS